MGTEGSSALRGPVQEERSVVLGVGPHPARSGQMEARPIAVVGNDEVPCESAVLRPADLSDCGPDICSRGSRIPIHNRHKVAPSKAIRKIHRKGNHRFTNATCRSA